MSSIVLLRLSLFLHSMLFGNLLRCCSFSCSLDHQVDHQVDWQLDRCYTWIVASVYGPLDLDLNLRGLAVMMMNDLESQSWCLLVVVT